MQDASAKVDFRQSNAVSIEKPIPRRAQPQPDEAVAAAVSACGLSIRVMIANRVEPSEGVVAATARSRVVGPLGTADRDCPVRLCFPLLWWV